MLVIPAIDLKDGRCVRLVKGRLEDMTVYSDHPAAMARSWESQGAQYLHVVDLDGAFEGAPRNTRAIAAIIEAVDIPVEVGGGIRTAEAVEALVAAGAARVILGTQAYQDPAFVAHACRTWPGQIALSVDVLKGYIAIKGWTSVTRDTAADFVARFAGDGIAAIIYTDIDRDGTLAGMDYDALAAFARAVGIPVIASGGVARIEDIRELKARESAGIAGVIVGKALYSGSVRLDQALAAARGS